MPIDSRCRLKPITVMQNSAKRMQTETNNDRWKVIRDVHIVNKHDHICMT